VGSTQKKFETIGWHPARAKISRTGVRNLGHQRKTDQDEERNQHTESRNFVVWLVQYISQVKVCRLQKIYKLGKVRE
jgi:hypothetical protein